MTSKRETFPHGEDLDYIQRWLRGTTKLHPTPYAYFNASTNKKLCYNGLVVVTIEPDGSLRGRLSNDSSGITGSRMVMTICDELGIADSEARHAFGGTRLFTIRGVLVESNIPFEIAGPLMMYAYRAKHKPLQ